MSVRICIDIDGTVCELKNIIGSYEKVRPLQGVVEFIQKRRSEGHQIILYTSRHMKSCDGNVGLVLAKQGKILFDWLKTNNIEYDEIYFGKPHADIYIDDNAYRFMGNWSDLIHGSWKESFASEASFKINIIIPMAGAGRRFTEAGYTLPKPLIPLRGEPMYRHSTRCLPIHLSECLIFLIPSDKQEILRNDIEENFGSFKPTVIVVDRVTGGQAETVLLSSGSIHCNRPTLIHNCDSSISVDFEVLEKKMIESDGLLVTFTSNEPKYSFIKADNEGNVLEVREKKVISNHASTGTYYFKSTVQMLTLIEEAIKNNETNSGEFYIAPLYNKMINAGQKISYLDCEHFDCYGTPQQLQEFS